MTAQRLVDGKSSRPRLPLAWSVLGHVGPSGSQETQVVDTQKKSVAGTTGLEPATSDVDRKKAQTQASGISLRRQPVAQISLSHLGSCYSTCYSSR